MNPRKSFAEIIQGYSKTYWRGAVIYLKHFNNLNLGELEFENERFESEAKAAGILNEKNKIESLKSDGLWDKKFNEISMLEEFIKQQETTKKNLLLDSQLKEINQQIKVSRDKVNKLIYEKSESLGLTIETYIRKKVNEFYIYYSGFMNSECTEPFFSKEKFDDLEDFELGNLISIYNNVIDQVSGDNIKRLAVSHIFQESFCLAENAFHFYGIPIALMTSYQTQLFIYGRYYKPMLENIKLTDEMLDNPDLISDAYHKKQNISNQVEDLGENQAGAASVHGATREELEASGYTNFVDLASLAQKKNGNLTSQEIMKAFAGK